MYILILIKDGKKHVYSEHGQMRVFDTPDEAMKLGQDTYGLREERNGLELETKRLFTVESGAVRATPAGLEKA